MDWNRDALAKRGFTGFVLFAELSSADVPTMPGVYVVLRPASATAMVKGSESGTGVAGTSGN